MLGATTAGPIWLEWHLGASLNRGNLQIAGTSAFAQSLSRRCDIRARDFRSAIETTAFSRLRISARLILLVLGLALPLKPVPSAQVGDTPQLSRLEVV